MGNNSFFQSKIKRELKLFADAKETLAWLASKRQLISDNISSYIYNVNLQSTPPWEGKIKWLKLLLEFGRRRFTIYLVIK